MSRIEHTAFSNTCLLVCYSHDKVKRKHILLSGIEKKHRIFINATGPFLHSRKTPENFGFLMFIGGIEKTPVVQNRLTLNDPIPDKVKKLS